MISIITDIIDEAFADSELTPNDQSKVRGILVSSYLEDIHFFDSETAANHYIYSNHMTDAQDVHRVGSVCFVLPGNLNINKQAKPFIRSLQDRYEDNPERIGTEVRKATATIHSVRQAFLNYRISRRKYTEGSHLLDAEPVYPEDIVLQKFYECGRKVQYATEEDTQVHLQSGNDPYQCHWCGNWHQGRKPSGEFIPFEMKKHRWQQSWRRHHGI
jgi:hypothetical protein